MISCCSSLPATKIENSFRDEEPSLAEEMGDPCIVQGLHGSDPNPCFVQQMKEQG